MTNTLKGSLIMMTFVLLATSCQKHPAELKFDQNIINLGDVRFSDGVHHINADFKNVGDSTLVIEKILSDCPCTKGTADKKSYKDGENGTVHITMDLNSFFPDSIVKSVRVYTNSPVREYEEIVIKCNLLNN